MNIFIDGREGTTGLALEDRLRALPNIRLLLIEPELRKDIGARKALYAQADVVFLCLPDAAAREAADLAGEDTIVIDASTAHRAAEGWAYGLPELSPEHRRAIETSNRIAVPGCHASGFCALVYPLIQAGMIDKNAALTCTSLTGYSGGGKSMIERYEGPDGPRDARPYALGLNHKHLPEMQAVCGLDAPPVFIPVIAPVRQGMLTMIPLPGDARRCHEALARYYGGQNGAIRVMPFGGEDSLSYGALDLQACNGTDRMELFVFGHGTQALLAARFDNLGKGAAGAALQCFNYRAKFSKKPAFMPGDVNAELIGD